MIFIFFKLDVSFKGYYSFTHINYSSKERLTVHFPFFCYEVYLLNKHQDNDTMGEHLDQIPT